MSSPNLWDRLRRARVVRVLAVYLGASWLVLQVTSVLEEALRLPPWISPVAVVLLLAGLVVVLATAWVQSHPLTGEREATDEVPGSWEVAWDEIGGAIDRRQVPHLTWGRALVGGLVAFSLLFGAAGAYVLVQDHRGDSFSPREARASTADPGIAVLPFTVSGSGGTAWAEGMVTLLSAGLDGAAGLRAIDSRTVLATWDQRVGDGARADRETNLAVARATGARYALLGSAVSIGEDARLVAELFDVDSGRKLGQGQVEGRPDDVLALVDQLSVEALRLVLEERGGELPAVDVAGVTTRSVPALRAFLEGEAAYRRARFEAAVEAYGRAVEADSTFALAHYRMASAQSWSLAFPPGSRAHREAAARFADRLPAREAALLRADNALRRTAPDALDSFLALTERFPDDAEAWYLLGEAYLHNRLGSPAEAEEAFRRAVELDPGFAPYRIHHVEMAFNVLLDSAEAARRLAGYRRVVDAGPGAAAKYVRLSPGMALAFGSPAERRRALDGLDTLGVDRLRVLSNVLMHPLTQGAREAVDLAALREADAAEREDVELSLVDRSFATGQVQKALRFAERPGVPRWMTVCLPVVARTGGVPVPETVVESRLHGGSGAGEDDGRIVGCRALAAAELGRWDRFEEAQGRLREMAGEAGRRGDSTAMQAHRGMAEIGRGFGLWKRGRPREAVEILEPLVRKTPRLPRVWLGALHLELDEPEEAVRHFARAWYVPLAYRGLGRAYEALGRREEAAEAYADFVEVWERYADPGLEPMIEEAREAIRRLEG